MIKDVVDVLHSPFSPQAMLASVLAFALFNSAQAIPPNDECARAVASPSDKTMIVGQITGSCVEITASDTSAFTLESLALQLPTYAGTIQDTTTFTIVGLVKYDATDNVLYPVSGTATLVTATLANFGSPISVTKVSQTVTEFGVYCPAILLSDWESSPPSQASLTSSCTSTLLVGLTQFMLTPSATDMVLDGYSLFQDPDGYLTITRSTYLYTTVIEAIRVYMLGTGTAADVQTQIDTAATAASLVVYTSLLQLPPTYLPDSDVLLTGYYGTSSSAWSTSLGAGFLISALFGALLL